MKFMYTNIAMALASRGYIVAVMDYAGETEMVELEDEDEGAVYSSLFSSSSSPLGSGGLRGRKGEKDEEGENSHPEKEEIGEEMIRKALEMRVEDARFVLDEFQRMGTFPTIGRGGGGEGGYDGDEKKKEGGGLNGRKVGIAGHSLGGATAFTAMHQDPRISAGASMDGNFFNHANAASSSSASHITTNNHSFLILRSQDQQQQTAPLSHPPQSSSSSSTKELLVQGAKFLDWTDYPMLWEEMGVWDKVPPAMREAQGSIEPQRMLQIQVDCLGEFFDGALKR